MKNICQTSVLTGHASPRFKACGQPATQSLVVSGRLCHYCTEHGAAAQRYVERRAQGDADGANV